MEYRSETRRSGPVFLDRGGERIAEVFENQDRTLVVGGTTWKLPDRRWVFVIDSQGVRRERVGSDLAGAVGFGVGVAVALALVNKLLRVMRLQDD